MTAPHDILTQQRDGRVATPECNMPLPVEADGTIRVSFADKEVIFTQHDISITGACELRPSADESISRAKITTFLLNYNNVVIISPNPMQHFVDFASQFVWVEAAGGIAVDGEGRVVMIRRNERWDLPKGHRECGEDFETCAMREAEEETGVKIKHIVRLLTTTLHCYNLYGKWEMKYTAWYAMDAESCDLTPQSEEGIVQAEWVKAEDVANRIKNSFSTIKKVFAAFYNK